MRKTAGAVLLLVALTACAPTGAASQVAATAAGFASALDRQDGTAACALLTEAARGALENDSGEPCDKAVLDVSSDASGLRVQVWGDEAAARAGHDTLFLDQTPNGWRVRAAGCTPQGQDMGYQCEVAP
ncbi:MAG: hypothetical protein M3O55_02750 [Actinomycetota bacterium]|nr:hypothetical protein [Actinomycetota bacterium]